MESRRSAGYLANQNGIVSVIPMLEKDLSAESVGRCEEPEESSIDRSQVRIDNVGFS